MEGSLVGFCNPLLDISSSGVSEEFLDKYQVKMATACLADSHHLPLYEDMKKTYQVEYIAGGAGQNSMRAAQWLLQTPRVVSYVGCVGDDENGRTLQKKAEEDGVNTLYRIDHTAPTGTCAVLIRDKERALIAYLGAANNYRKEDHYDTENIQKVIQKAKYFYVTGFFVSDDTTLAVAKHAAEHNKYFLFNLSATFIIDVKWDLLNQLMPYTDVIFGNEDEWAAFGKKSGWGTDLSVILEKTAQLPKENKNRSRIVIATQGAKNTFVYYEGKLLEFSPIKLEPSQIVDTNGAGDSFVGGFLAGFIQGKSIEECIRAAHYVASECVRRSGATFPPKPNFQWKE